MASKRRILGIDPGLRTTGFGVITIEGAGSLRGLWLYPQRRRRASGASRVILTDLAAVISLHRPSEVAVEKVFVNVNPQSTLLLGRRAAPRFAPRYWPSCPSSSTPRCR